MTCNIYEFLCINSPTIGQLQATIVIFLNTEPERNMPKQLLRAGVSSSDTTLQLIIIFNLSLKPFPIIVD